MLLHKTDYTEWRSGAEDLASVQNQSSKNLTSRMLQRFTFLEVSWFEKLCQNDDRTKGAIFLLENLKECFSKVFVFDNLKVMILIPLNTQISFKNSLAVTIQLIDRPFNRLNLTVSLTQSKFSVVTTITVFQL